MADLREFLKKPVTSKMKESQQVELPPPVIKPMPMREGIEYKTNYFPELLESLRKTSSSNDKIALLKEFGSKSPYICEILQYAYDPFKKYYVTDKNLIANPQGTQRAFDQDYLAFGKLLDRLNNREITGNEALNAVQSFIQPFTKEDGQNFIRILNRDVKAGISDKSINKALPECIPTFSVALANHYEDRKEFAKQQLPFKETWYSRKLDGVRTLCVKKNNDTNCYSRTGNELGQLDKIKDTLNKMPIDDIVFDGEAVIIDKQGQEYFRLTSSLLNSKKEDTITNILTKMKQLKADPHYMIFDLIPLKDFKKMEGSTSYSEKYSNMNTLKWLNTPHTTLVPQKQASSFSEVKKAFDHAIEQNWEGLILRNGQAGYQGKRTNNLLKYKSFQDAGFSVVGAFAGDKDTKYSNTMGGLIIDIKGNQIHVGTGFTDDERNTYWDQYQNGTLGKTATIKFQREEINPDGSHTLILPSFKGFRDTFI